MTHRPAVRGWTGCAAAGALAAAGLLGCGGDGSPQPPAPRGTAAQPTATQPLALPAPQPARPAPPPASSTGQATSTSTSCVDATCEVRATCNGETHVRRGPAPVKTSSSNVDGRSAIVLDFAGSGRDAVIRC